jgi:ferric-dicitrate binding protein FerR (iron transport regulator)
MTNQHEILVKLSRREASPEEQQAFRQWVLTLSPEELESLLDKHFEIAKDIGVPLSPDAGLLVAVHAAIDREEETPAITTKRRTIPIRWMSAAACILIAVISTVLLMQPQTPADKKAGGNRQKIADILPGSSGAILTLTNGSQIVLDSMGDGPVAKDGSAETVLHNGKLIYNVNNAGAEKVGYNIMTTPKGRQFRVALPDGTVVWLNAASSLQYPTAFIGDKREVSLKGEAYFEVAKNKTMPFVVHAKNNTVIEVLGTDFDVDAYDNNSTLDATLLTGSIKVNGTLLRPGQQAQVDNAVRVVDAIDTGKVMAWKNGLFNFEGATLSQVMKQLERWYDIEVVYENGIPDIVFGGEMTKNISLSGLLLILEKSDIHYRLEGRKLIILP